MHGIATASVQMIRTAMRVPLLERDEEHQLALRWKENRDQQAMNKIVVAHMRLVISMAARFRNYGLPMNDLIQEGHIGLLEAAARFDPEREVRFSTYATWWIRASIQDYMLRNWSIVRGGTSSAQKALFFNLRRLRARLSKGQEAISESMIYKKISQSLGAAGNRRGADESAALRPRHVVEGAASATTMKAGRSGWISWWTASRCPTAWPPNDRQRAPAAAGLRGALVVLNTRELQIIKERRLRDDGATLESLGDKLGISKERVRQIESRAMEKLQERAGELQPGTGARGCQRPDLSPARSVMILTLSPAETDARRPSR